MGGAAVPARPEISGKWLEFVRVLSVKARQIVTAWKCGVSVGLSCN